MLEKVKELVHQLEKLLEDEVIKVTRYERFWNEHDGYSIEITGESVERYQSQEELVSAWENIANILTFGNYKEEELVLKPYWFDRPADEWMDDVCVVMERLPESDVNVPQTTGISEDGLPF